MAAITSATAWLAVRDSGGLPGGEPEAHLFVGVQGRGRDKGLLQALPTSIAGIVVCDYYVVEVQQIISPRISAEGTERELHQLISEIDLEAS